MNALPIITALAALAAGASLGLCAEKTEHFDRDPGWDALNNHVVPDHVCTATQDFGYDAKRDAVGGRITRASKPAYCAAVIDKPKTLSDKLTASGAFAITDTGGASGIFFGWFNSVQSDGSGRPISAVGLELDGEKNGGRLAVRLHTHTNKSAGTFITRYERYKSREEKAEKRPTPIRNDGTRYAWVMTYDPDAAGGNGQVQFTVKGDAAVPEDFEGKLFTFDLPPGYKQDGATLDRFGLLNSTKPGGTMVIHFSDIKLNGAPAELSKWVESGSRDTYDDLQVGVHDFGFSEKTNHASGARPGEIGGDLWRSGPYGYYADRVGPLSFDDRLEARGRVVLMVGAPDSDMHLGWFDSAARDDSPAKLGSFIGVHVGGPTRVGHYFQPAFATAKGTDGRAEEGPVLAPRRTYDWSIVYDPTASKGNGEIRVTLGDESVTHPLKQGIKAQGGTFDRFGLFTSTIGGQLVRIYLDDVTYTSAK